ASKNGALSRLWKKMIDSGPNTAAAVTMIVKVRGERNCCARFGAATVPGMTAVPAILFAAAGRDVLFPLLEELQTLGRIEQAGDFAAQRKRFHVRTELLRQLCGGVRGIDIPAYREQFDIAADQLLPTLRQDVVSPKLRRVRVLRLLADEHDA